MAFYTNATGEDQLPEIGRVGAHVLSNTIRFASQNCVQNDVVLALKIPADTWVLKVWAEVATAEGEATTIDVGDYTTASTPVAVDADGWLNDASVNSAATVVGASEAYVALGKRYTTESWITVTCNTSATYNAAVVTIKALAIKG